jgi:flagellar hook-associated protein 1 FlgK
VRWSIEPRNQPAQKQPHTAQAMSIFSTLQIANNALTAAQLGMQVVGNNIANANTPGYVRQDMVLSPAPAQRIGGLLVGMGVDVEAVVQRIDRFLEDRLRGAAADLADGEMQEKVYLELEALIGELSETDLSTSLTNFFGALNDILNQPESVSVRNLAVLLGETLTTDVNRLADRVLALRADVNDQIAAMKDEINGLLRQIAKLNTDIVAMEGGEATSSDAVGLRDARGVALAELAELLAIRTSEQPNGSVTVFSEGDFIVFEGNYREIDVRFDPDRGIGLATLRLAATEKPLSPPSGKLDGLMTARDEILGGFLDGLDEFARTLIFEFNQVYSAGQGLSGYSEVQSEFSVDDVNLPLDHAGLSYTPVNGSFQVLVRNKQTGLTQTTDVFVPLSGLGSDMSLEELRQALDDVNGLKAEITPARQLAVHADSPLVEFAFARDSSGVLAALGLGTFFTGTSARDMGVSQLVREDPGKFAASKSGIGADAENAAELAAFLDRNLESQDGQTISVMYDRLIGETAQSAAVARSVADGFRVFHQTLEGQHLAVTGVSLDEEAVKMIAYQRVFQANARLVATLSEMLDVLVNL